MEAMKLLLLAAVVLPIGLAAPAGAQRTAGPPVATVDATEGKFAFDSMKVERSKCMKIEGALLTRLRKEYRCVARSIDERTASNTGKPIFAECATGSGRSRYLVFDVLGDCKDEREAMLANAP